MPNSPRKNDCRLNRIHTDAVRQEMGERLSAALGPQSIELPRHLHSAMKQMAEIDGSTGSNGRSKRRRPLLHNT
jgi:hypothetical protein